LIGQDTTVKLTGADALAEAIGATGVKHVFGIPGQRILPLFDTLSARAGIAVVLSRHEQGASFMADAYARRAGFGVCVSTSGPGATNMVTGAAASYMDSVPMLVVTAQAATTEFGRYGIQEGTGIGRTPDIVAMFAATAKWAGRPMSVEEVGPMCAEAIAIAFDGRPGPVHLDVPSDLLLEPLADLPERQAAPASRPVPSQPPPCDPGQLAEAAALLVEAEWPLVLVGNGAARSGAMPAVMDLARRIEAPVACTLMAKGHVDEYDPLVLGPVGLFGSYAANRALHECADVVLALGVGFSYLTSSAWPSTLDRLRLVRVDIDPRELTNNYQPSVSLLADVGEAVRGLLGRTSARLPEKPGSTVVKELQAANPPPDLPANGAVHPGAVHPVDAIDAINEFVTPTTTVVADVGQNGYWSERYVRNRGNGRFIINGGLGAMGHGVAGAVGASLASGREDPDPVICITGDGGFLMTGLEVSTAVEQGVPVVWVIFNNGSLGTQKRWFAEHERPEVACNLPPTRFAQLAESLGASGYDADSIGGLRAALAAATAQAGPAVIDLTIDPAPAPKMFFWEQVATG